MSILKQEFDTLIEDGSLEEVKKLKLYHFFSPDVTAVTWGSGVHNEKARSETLVQVCTLYSCNTLENPPAKLNSWLDH